MMRKPPSALLSSIVLASLAFEGIAEESTDMVWGERSTKNGVETSERDALFRDGNHGMCRHWGFYSHPGGQWKNKTFYGIGERILCQMKLLNQQAASPLYHSYPFGVISFLKAGRHKANGSLAEGDASMASLEAIRLMPAR